MIYLYSGTPGSGKSLDLARMVLSENIHTPFIINFEMRVKHMNKSKLSTMNPKGTTQFK